MKKAFTLIELLVVVLIIGILAAIAVPQYQKAVARSRMAEGWMILNSIGRAGEIFFLHHGRFPENADFDSLDIDYAGETQSGLIVNDNYSISLNYSNHIVGNHVVVKKVGTAQGTWLSQQIIDSGTLDRYTCRYYTDSKIGKQTCELICNTTDAADFTAVGATQYCWFDKF